MAQNIASITMIVSITMVALYGGAMAQSSGCTTMLISLSPCLSYISGNTTTPSSGCCSQLASMVQSQPQCLCQVLNGDGSSLGVNMNQTQALALPSACNVQTPPTSRCNAASPGNAPLNPSGKGSGTNKDSGSSDASSIRFTTIRVVFSLLVAVYSMVF